MSGPYYQDDFVTLYHGDYRDIIADLPSVDAVITDPPYGETDLDWDVWPIGWPSAMRMKSKQLWCFGSSRMFWDNRSEFSEWNLAQDIVWEKHNGSGSHADRFRRVHELAYHFYHGEWASIFKSPVKTMDAAARTIRMKTRPVHWGEIDSLPYKTEQGGPRLMRSVIPVASCHGYAENETQKPDGIIRPLVEYSVPGGGLVLDPFAGSGTTLAVARQQGKHSIGIEIRESQCATIVRRLAQAELLQA